MNMLSGWRSIARFGILLSALVLSAAVLAACGGGDDASSTAPSGGASTAADSTNAGKPVNVAFIPVAFANPYIQANISAMDKAAKALNVKMTYLDPKGDINTQANQISNLAATKQVDGIIVYSLGAGIDSALTDATDAGLKLVCMGSACGPDSVSIKPQIPGQTAFVGVNPAQEGVLAAEALVEYCEGKDPCKVALVCGAPDFAVDVERIKVFKKIVAEHPNMKYVTAVYGNFDRAKALDVTADLLQANPDLNGIATSTDQMGLGIEQAIDEARLKGKVAIVGGAASEEGVKAVRAKRWIADTVWLPQDEARVSLKLIADAIRGKDVPSSVDIRKRSPIGPIVTQDNAAQFTPQWKAAG